MEKWELAYFIVPEGCLRVERDLVAYWLSGELSPEMDQIPMLFGMRFV
jgi:hypothetical protein